MGMRSNRRDYDEGDDVAENVVHISRVAKVVKGGRRFNFRALVVVGDGNGRVGVGVGKAREVPSAIRKGVERARKAMVSVPLWDGRTIQHEMLVKFGAAKVMMKPASAGTGVIAGGGVRAVVEAAGIKDILSKSLGSDNIFNVVMATFKGLQEMTDVAVQAERRGKPIADLLPSWRGTSDAD